MAALPNLQVRQQNLGKFLQKRKERQKSGPRSVVTSRHFCSTNFFFLGGCGWNNKNSIEDKKLAHLFQKRRFGCWKRRRQRLIPWEKRGGQKLCLSFFIATTTTAFRSFAVYNAFLSLHPRNCRAAKQFGSFKKEPTSEWKFVGS